MGRQRRGRRGSSYVDVQAALAVFGVALAGLAPAAVAQLRLMARIEARFPAGAVHYLAPPADPWAGKLGAGAALQDTAPAAAPAAPGAPAYLVSVESVDGGPGDAATAVVTATPAGGPGP